MIAPPVYTVVAHDTLSAIAQAHNLPLSEFEMWNPQVTDPDVIHVGEVLQLSASPSPSSIASIPPSPAQQPATSSTPATGDLSDVPGVPRAFAACVAFRESSDGADAVFNGGDYGIITASGLNVNGQPLSKQKQAFTYLYQQYGTQPWVADGCPQHLYHQGNPADSQSPMSGPWPSG